MKKTIWTIALICISYMLYLYSWSHTLGHWDSIRVINTCQSGNVDSKTASLGFRIKTFGFVTPGTSCFIGEIYVYEILRLESEHFDKTKEYLELSKGCVGSLSKNLNDYYICLLIYRDGLKWIKQKSPNNIFIQDIDNRIKGLTEEIEQAKNMKIKKNDK